MPEYGITENGFVLKRLDVIADEIHADLSDAWGFNTKLNPQSYLNVLVTAFADKIAELWEIAEDDYYAMYPSSAEHISLDNAAQFGGSMREKAAKTYYPIHCTGVDGTTLAAGTVIASKTNPAIHFAASGDSTITRSSFNKVEISVASVESQAGYSIALNNKLYTYTSPENATLAGILSGIAQTVVDEDFVVTPGESTVLIETANVQQSNVLTLTENLTTASVTSIINFASEEYGEVVLPKGTITVIVRSVAGFKACTNLCDQIAGRLRETDVEFRQSYAHKIFNRSSRMLSSIESAILSNVQGIKSIKTYENDTNEVDSEGRWPHSIEVVVEGGSNTEIAAQILKVKAGGINTFGSVTVDIPGEEGENIAVRFNRPQYVYCWFEVQITIRKTQALPANYTELIKKIVLAQVSSLTSGEDVTPQRYLAQIYAGVSGIEYIEILLYASAESGAAPPATLTERSVSISSRQLAVTSETRIEVTLSE